MLEWQKETISSRMGADMTEGMAADPETVATVFLSELVFQTETVGRVAIFRYRVN
jgi:hypothetical protein